MNGPQREFFFIPNCFDFSAIEKLSILALLLEGVLQQLVNCFLKASGGSLTFRHKLVISSKTSFPKASNGQRFPCPAVPSLVFLGGSRAAAPIGDKVL